MNLIKIFVSHLTMMFLLPVLTSHKKETLTRDIASKEIFPHTQKILNYYTRGMGQYEVFCNEHFVIKSKKLSYKKKIKLPRP